MLPDWQIRRVGCRTVKPSGPPGSNRRTCNLGRRLCTSQPRVWSLRPVVSGSQPKLLTSVNGWQRWFFAGYSREANLPGRNSCRQLSSHRAQLASRRDATPYRVPQESRNLSQHSSVPLRVVDEHQVGELREPTGGNDQLGLGGFVALTGDKAGLVCGGAVQMAWRVQ